MSFKKCETCNKIKAHYKHGYCFECYAPMENAMKSKIHVPLARGTGEHWEKEFLQWAKLNCRFSNDKQKFLTQFTDFKKVWKASHDLACQICQSPKPALETVPNFDRVGNLSGETNVS